MPLQLGWSDFAYSETNESLTGIVERLASIERSTVLTYNSEHSAALTSMTSQTIVNFGLDRDERVSVKQRNLKSV